jgi:glycosyltransferase involved in cell wall biosynthesis
MFVSVIIPVYNAQVYLERTLSAVFFSDYPDKELIVVDDASTDRSVEIAKKFSGLVIESKIRQGPGLARNQGAGKSRGDILFFVDADVEISCGTISEIVREMESHPEVSAVFGSYDDRPLQKNFFSQYKDLFHHFIHQQSREEATTFWAGCGAVRREAFLRAGGFPKNFKSFPLEDVVEDVVLGYKMKEQGAQIRLSKHIQVKHLKKWSFWTLLKTDIFKRAIPWTRFAFQKGLPSDLNFKFADRASALLVWGLLLSLCLCVRWAWMGIFSLILTSLLACLNRDLYLFFLRKRGFRFASLAMLYHWFYYLYSSFAFFIFSLVLLIQRFKVR